MDKLISSLMVSHHGLIAVYFNVLKDKIKKGEDAKNDFNNFKWQLEKHFFVEEKAIFNYNQFWLKNEKIYHLVRRLEKEHEEMMSLMKKAEEELSEGGELNLSHFEEMHREHVEMEEKELYPYLDKELDKSKIEEIIGKINDIVLKNV